MIDSEEIVIVWKGVQVGRLVNPRPDMAYLKGEWKSNGLETAKAFEQKASQLNARDVIMSAEKGFRVRLTYNSGSSNEHHALVVSLDNNNLLIKRILGQEAIDWLLENVPQ